MLFRLSHLAVLKLKGTEAHQFLQGQVTSDIHQVTATHYQPAALCNLQGRIVSLMDVVQWQDALYLILPQDLLENVRHILAKPAKFSRVELSEEQDLCVVGCEDLSNASLPFPRPSSSYACLETQDGVIACIEPSLYFLLVTQTYANTLPVIHDRQLWHQAKLKRKTIEIYPFTSEQFLPHRLNLQHTPYLSFNKGCYRGQEIIARTHYRATLKHQLARYEVESEEILVPGMEVFDEAGQSLGELVDCCPTGEQRYLIAASLRFEHPHRVRFGTHQNMVNLKAY